MKQLLPLLLKPVTFLLLLAILTAGCGSVGAGTAGLPTVAAPAEQPPETEAAATPSPAPIAQAENTATPTPTLTVEPSLTPTPVPTETPTETPTASTPPTATPCAAAGEVVDGSYQSATSGSAEAYRIYLPPCYGDDGHRYPALYLFAGNIHDESKWDELGLDEAADAAIQAAELPPLVVVMPNGGWLANNTSGGPGSYESLVLNDLMPHIESEYCVWAEPHARAIGGLSRGGYWALEIAFRFPDQFASVGGHSAALLDEYAGPTINPQYTALSNPLGDLRIYLDIGADDYLRTNTIQLHNDMEAAGVVHTWHLNEGRHEDAYWAAHVGEYLRWYGEPWPFERESYPGC